MSRPRLAVRGYATAACDTLISHRFDAPLLPARGEPGSPSQPDVYGADLGDRFDDEASVDMLIGPSVGAQAAAVVTA